MRIAAFGAKTKTAQLPRIEEGFIFLGHSIANNGDVAYANDPTGFDDAIEHKEKFGSKLILNILDRPFHQVNIKEWDTKIKHQLAQADIVTSISKTTQKQVKEFLGFDSQIIYQPIKDVFFSNSIRTKFTMSVCRGMDLNKRLGLAGNAANILAKSCDKNLKDMLHAFGSERANEETWCGEISDLRLNTEYNTHQICWITSYNEGLCLPMIESMVCGCVPIVCNDMTTAWEFAPEEFLCKPDIIKLGYKAIDVHKNFDKYHKIALEFGAKYKKQFNKIQIARNILTLL